MRVREQIEYFAQIHGLGGREARVAAGQWLDRLGLGERTTARVEELSHGNQQRAQLAVALVHAPDVLVLVLDEPFAGLDPIGVGTLGAVVRERAAGGAAVVCSSHQLDLVEDLCDDIAVIDDRRIVLAGALRDVRAASRFATRRPRSPATATRRATAAGRRVVPRRSCCGSAGKRCACA